MSSCSSSPLTVLIWRNVALHLDDEDLFALACTSLTTFDAVDSDLVWRPIANEAQVLFLNTMQQQPAAPQPPILGGRLGRRQQRRFNNQMRQHANDSNNFQNASQLASCEYVRSDRSTTRDHGNTNNGVYVAEIPAELRAGEQLQDDILMLFSDMVSDSRNGGPMLCCDEFRRYLAWRAMAMVPVTAMMAAALLRVGTGVGTWGTALRQWRDFRALEHEHRPYRFTGKLAAADDDDDGDVDEKTYEARLAERSLLRAPVPALNFFQRYRLMMVNGLCFKHPGDQELDDGLAWMRADDAQWLGDEYYYLLYDEILVGNGLPAESQRFWITYPPAAGRRGANAAAVAQVRANYENNVAEMVCKIKRRTNPWLRRPFSAVSLLVQGVYLDAVRPCIDVGEPMLLRLIELGLNSAIVVLGVIIITVIEVLAFFVIPSSKNVIAWVRASIAASPGLGELRKFLDVAMEPVATMLSALTGSPRFLVTAFLELIKTIKKKSDSTSSSSSSPESQLNESAFLSAIAAKWSEWTASSDATATNISDFPETFADGSLSRMWNFPKSVVEFPLNHSQFYDINSSSSSSPSSSWDGPELKAVQYHWALGAVGMTLSFVAISVLLRPRVYDRVVQKAANFFSCTNSSSSSNNDSDKSSSQEARSFFARSRPWLQLLSGAHVMDAVWSAIGIGIMGYTDVFDSFKMSKVPSTLWLSSVGSDSWYHAAAIWLGRIGFNEDLVVVNSNNNASSLLPPHVEKQLGATCFSCALGALWLQLLFGVFLGSIPAIGTIIYNHFNSSSSLESHLEAHFKLDVDSAEDVDDDGSAVEKKKTWRDSIGALAWAASEASRTVWRIVWRNRRWLLKDIILSRALWVPFCFCVRWRLYRRGHGYFVSSVAAGLLRVGGACLGVAASMLL